MSYSRYTFPLAKFAFVLLLIFGLKPFTVLSQTLNKEVQNRREKLVEILPDGLIVLPSKWEEKAMEQPAWIQDATFYYFTSLATAPGAILLIDGPANRTILFSGPDPQTFGVPIPDFNVQNRPDWIGQSGVSAVMPNSEFVTYVRSRMNEGVKTVYLDQPRRPSPSEAPEGMLEVSGFHRMWQQSMSIAFPNVEIKSAAAAIGELVWIKSDYEVAQLTKNASYSAKALREGMTSIRDGLTQRQVEGEVVNACLQAGAEGPSFWPWVMTGPNAQMKRLVKSFYDDSNLNRTFKNGELVRVDVGCMAGGYGGDVGRTVPVSGTFSKDQATIWDILISGYLAGMKAMMPGKTLDQIREASILGMKEWGRTHPKDAEIVSVMAAESGGVGWHIHGVGIESGETAEPVLEAGSVIAFEPGFATAADAYYLEDMILITPTGYQVLTQDLPYTSSEMHSFLSKSR
jgi:Xaa-Pro aminopeptidase